MPYYEFYSPDTNTIYTFFARSLSYSGCTPICPDPAHPGARMIKRPSRFALTGRAKEPKEPMPGADSGGDAFDDPRMERALAAMEKEFSGLDEENPDPRHLGRLMRRMSELTGESMPPEMEEMTRRLEAGEDPEKLEEQFGDAFGEEGGDPEGMGLPGMAGESGPESASKRRAVLRLRRPPVRDTAIYEMADYLGPGR